MVSRFEEGEVPEVLERVEVPEVQPAPREQTSWVPPVPPEGLGTVLYDSDERAARADLRRQIAAMEAELGQLFGSAFPRTGIDFGVPAPGGGPRILTVNELERVRDSLAARVKDVRGRLHDHAYAEEQNRLLIEEMTADPESLQVGPGLQRGHRRARLPALALPPPLGPAGDDHRLVAGDRLIGLPVSRGACGPGVI